MFRVLLCGFRHIHLTLFMFKRDDWRYVFMCGHSPSVPNDTHCNCWAGGGGSCDDMISVLLLVFHFIHELPIVGVVLEHGDCLLIFIPTFDGCAIEANEYLLSCLFHLELQAIVVCEVLLIPMEMVMAQCPPPHMQMTMVIIYRYCWQVYTAWLGLCCPMVFRLRFPMYPHIWHHHLMHKAFDKFFLLSTLCSVFPTPSHPLCTFHCLRLHHLCPILMVTLGLWESWHWWRCGRRQAHRKTNFMKDFNFDTMSRQHVKFLPRELIGISCLS